MLNIQFGKRKTFFMLNKLCSLLIPLLVIYIHAKSKLPYTKDRIWTYLVEFYLVLRRVIEVLFMRLSNSILAEIES